MGLRMTSPLRQGKNGTWRYRKVVPKDLRTILGKTEIKESLGTRDDALARLRTSERDAHWQGIFIKLRQAATSEYKLSHSDALALAGLVYKDTVDFNKNNPDPEGTLRTRARWNTFLADGVVPGEADVEPSTWDEIVEQRHNEVITRLSGQGIPTTPENVDLAKRAMNPAFLEARKRLIATSEFRVGPDLVREHYPDWVPLEARVAGPQAAVNKKYSILELFDQMSRERDHAASTRSRWRPIVEKIALEHPDIRTITGEWCVAYKDRLIAAGLTPKTIKEGNLAVLKNLCNYAVDNLRIPTSPMKGVSIRVKARALLRQTKGYSDAEAKVVLEATLGDFSNLLPVDQHAARRWIPWLGYYSGARGGELAQLRKQDFRQQDGIWLMHVDPEAGTVKSGEPRDVAIHPHLLEQGLMDFVLHCPRDSLFYDARRKRVENAKNPPPVKTAENLAKWVRSLGLKDVQLQPNHGWRHRFTTMAREVDMHEVTCRYIQGHAPELEAEKYGNFPPKVLLREISKIPPFELKD